MALSKTPIRFHYLIAPFYFPDRTAIKQLLRSIFKEHCQKIEAVNYIFCSDKYLLNMNRNFLNHEYYTDVITFELNRQGEAILSDVYISLDRARDNAKRYNVSIYNEVLRLLIHGSLHLCGFKDKSKKDITQIRKLEDYYLKHFVSRETI